MLGPQGAAARHVIEDALRGRTTARPPLVNDSRLKINALGRCGPTSLADSGSLTWLKVGCLETLWKHLGGKDGLCGGMRTMNNRKQNDEKSMKKPMNKL